MVKKLVLMCEESHHDPLILESELNILRNINHDVWKHSLIEENPSKRDSNFNPQEKCYPYNANMSSGYELKYELRSRYLYDFTSHEFDVAGEQFSFDSLFDLCEVLNEPFDINHAFEALHSMVHLKSKAAVERNTKLVDNILKILQNIDGNIIGWAGKQHCRDLFHSLDGNYDKLDHKVFFVYLHSLEDINLSENRDQMLGYLDLVINTYAFRNCLDNQNIEILYDYVVSDLDRLRYIIVEEPDKGFLNSALLTNITLSLNMGVGTLDPMGVLSTLDNVLKD